MLSNCNHNRFKILLRSGNEETDHSNLLMCSFNNDIEQDLSKIFGMTKAMLCRGVEKDSKLPKRMHDKNYESIEY